MTTESDARQLVLSRIEQSFVGREAETFVVQSCSLSAQRDYWIIRANSADYVLNGNFSKCYVGVNAYLVDVSTGLIEIVASSYSVDEYLQEKYDLREAAGRHYVLCAGFPSRDKRAIINLRQKLECSLHRARLLAEEGRAWAIGTRVILMKAQGMLRQHTIETSIVLVDDPGDARPIDRRVWHWDALRQVLQ